MIMDSLFKEIYDKHKNDKLRLMRLYNIALFEKKMEMDENQLIDYLNDMINKVRSKSTFSSNYFN